MKALVLREYNQFEYTDVPVPKFGPDEVLVEIKACGICGSDVHGMDGSTGRRIPPIIMGHEASGIIAETGANVTEYSKGDRVTFDSTIYCGDCYYCRQGFINLCDNRKILGVSCEEFRRDGTLAEYAAVPQHILYRLPDGLSFERAAAVEPLSIALHAVKHVRISESDTAVVIGAGVIGLFVVQSLKAAGCKNIVAVDINESRLKLAHSLGADNTIVSNRQNTPVEIHDLASGRGADYVFDAAGNPETFITGLDSLKKGGSFILIGNVSPSVQFPLQQVVSREITIYGSCASNGEYPECLDMIQRGIINVEKLISRTAPLSEGAQWFKKLYNREDDLIKVILKP
ncbi:galactitol-1-phosphate 5-dehydrogenase [bacterium]|nr:galactitol-1-phosphate 5-dehydrogenase [bacterium]